MLISDYHFLGLNIELLIFIVICTLLFWDWFILFELLFPDIIWNKFAFGLLFDLWALAKILKGFDELSENKFPEFCWFVWLNIFWFGFT
jgi:hypothetical protein